MNHEANYTERGFTTLGFRHILKDMRIGFDLLSRRKSRRTVLSALVVVSALTGLGMMASGVSKNDEPKAEHSAQLEVEVSGVTVTASYPNGEKLVWGDEDAVGGKPRRVFDWTTSEPYAALVGVGALDGESSRIVELTSDDGTREIAEHAIRAEYNHDGTLISVVTDAEYIAVDVTTRAGDPIVHLSNAYDSSWSPSANRLLFVEVGDGTTNRLRLFDADTRHVQNLTAGDHEDYAASFHPSGEWILFSSSSRDTCWPFFQMDVDSGAIAPLRPRKTECGGLPWPLYGAWSSDGRWFVYEWRSSRGSEVWALGFSDGRTLSSGSKMFEGKLPGEILDGRKFDVAESGEAAERLRLR